MTDTVSEREIAPEMVTRSNRIIVRMLGGMSVAVIVAGVVSLFLGWPVALSVILIVTGAIMLGRAGWIYYRHLRSGSVPVEMLNMGAPNVRRLFIAQMLVLIVPVLALFVGVGLAAAGATLDVARIAMFSLPFALLAIAILRRVIAVRQEATTRWGAMAADLITGALVIAVGVAVQSWLGVGAAIVGAAASIAIVLLTIRSRAAARSRHARSA